MTTATPTSTTATRTDAPPLPTGPAWDFFSARHPGVDQARIARRWQDGATLYRTGKVGAPDANGTRIVRSQNADDPNRPMEQPGSYTVNVAIYRPREYACNCPDWQYRGGYAGFCKHICAVWHTVAATCIQRQMERIAASVTADLLAANREEFTHLLVAIASHDGKAARLAAARLAGWPARQRNRNLKQGERRMKVAA